MAEVWNNNEQIMVDFSSQENSVDNTMDNNLEVSRSMVNEVKNDNTKLEKIKL